VLTAARDRRLAAVVSDSAWSDVRHWLRPSLLGSLRPRSPFSTVSLQIAQWRTGADLDSLRPVDAVRNLARPALFVHGTADEQVPVSDTEELFAAAAGPKQILRADGAAHGDTIASSSPEYRQVIVEFLERSLSRSPGTAPAPQRSASPSSMPVR
jgi:fermentation-respiration switch protein FrsA (DUF1100 family)